MSGFEMKPVDEAQFEAFLQGKEDLSGLLREMPQPKCSPELDQAILAMISGELANHDAGNSEKAANDAEFGGEKQRPRFFFQRFRLPLSLAASVCLVFPLALWHLGYLESDSDLALGSSEQVATVAKPIPQPPASLEMAERPQSPPVLVSEKKAASSPHVLADTAAPAPAPAPAPVYPGREPAKAVQAAPPAERGNDAISRKSEFSSDVQPQRSASANPELEARRERMAKDKQEALQIDDARRQAEQFARTKLAKEKALEAPAAPVQAPAAAAPAPPVAEKRQNNADSAEISGLASGMAQAEHNARAKAWLQLVEELIKADLHQEALQEWKKFKKAYPYHPVPERLQEQIKVMQN